MKPSLLLGIDQSTTATKVTVLDSELRILASAATEFPQHFPQPGWVEHDLEQIWESLHKSLSVISKTVDLKQISTIGITNQRETVVWQDRRTADFCETLKQQKLEATIRNKTGLLLDPYFSGTKIHWALQNQSAVQKAAKTGTLGIGTIDSYLIARLCQQSDSVIEASNASRTLLLNLHTLQWDAELLSLFGIQQDWLPEVKPSFGLFGTTRGIGLLPDGIPIMGVLGDQQAALLGQGCLEAGQAKCTFGTGAFLLMNTGKKPILSQNRLLTTVAWAESHKNVTYALEGSAFIAGAAIQWFRDQWGWIQKSHEIETLANTVSDSQGVTFVPALTGMGAPYWDPEARGILSGLTRGTQKGHIARAVLEGIALQNCDILSAMETDLKGTLTDLFVDGGASQNNLLMQIQADTLQRNLHRPAFTDTTLLGAIFAAGRGHGIWTSWEEVLKSWRTDKKFTPLLSADQITPLRKQWHLAIKRALIH